MSITSASICAAAEQLHGLVGFNGKTGQYIVRFSEDSFGMDVPDSSITPVSEFVWSPLAGDLMSLSRARLQLLLEQRLDDRLNIGEALRVYMRRKLPRNAAYARPEITAALVTIRSPGAQLTCCPIASLKNTETACASTTC